ncbi:HMG high mobility group box-containing protein [Nitzschia inconspicua]|uniref:HMG high mobility group box-containing protein n=1 Tax=Nitzschia inconspicua TaxID=303405 RepID=A0A9K3PR11_9STRA|nr:HMG high mobility group box-containing protein [Nitzschia inconspicua]
MDKISQSSDHASQSVRAETNPLSAGISEKNFPGNNRESKSDAAAATMEDEGSNEMATDYSVPTEQALSGDLEVDGGEDTGASMKKRTWRKPKDKPKRPLSSYNIYFQHQRERIVEGQTGEASPEEIVQSVEAILSRPATKRRHRKSHGRISFGDLARSIAESWKSVSPKARSIFDHYAERDSLRYKRELKVWKDRKDMELEANTLAKHSNFINSMNMSTSMRSEGSTTSEYLESLPREGSLSQHSTMSSYNNPGRSFSSSFNSSTNSVDSVSFNLSSAEPEYIQQAFHRQQQILQQQLRLDQNIMMMNPGSVGFAGAGHGMMMGEDGPMMAPGSNAFHSSFSSFPTRMDIRGNGMEAAMTRSGFDGYGSGVGHGNGASLGPGVLSSGGEMDGLLGASSMQAAGGMSHGRQMLAPIDRQARGGGMGNGPMCFAGHASFSGGFGPLSQQQQHRQQLLANNIMTSPAMMGMGTQQQQQNSQASGVDRMQQRFEWLQEQQRRLYMQQQEQQQQSSSVHQLPMSNASNHSLQMDVIGGSGHVISDRSQSDHNASYSTFASSAQGFGGNQMSMQQLVQHQFGGGVGEMMTPTMVSMTGSGPMNISNSSDRPSSDQHGASMSEFIPSNQSFMGSGNSNNGNVGF